MKNVVLFVVIGIVLAGVGLVAVGGGGANHREHSVSIDQPAREVFAWITQPNKISRWRHGFVSTRALNGARLRVGTQFIETVGLGEKKVEVHVEVTELAYDRRIVMLKKGPDYESLVRYELETKGDATLLRYSCDTQYEGFVAKLFAPLNLVSADRRSPDDFVQLKKHMESGL